MFKYFECDDVEILPVLHIYSKDVTCDYYLFARLLVVDFKMLKKVYTYRI